MRYFYLLTILLFISVNSHAEELVRVEALNGKVSILAPKDFGPMPQELLELKYPASRRPTDVLTDKTGGVTLAFNHTNTPMKPSQVREARVPLSQMFHNMHPSAKWIRDEVIEQNGNVFIVLEVITPAIDTQIHNIIYCTSVDDRFMLVAFNSTVEQADEWIPHGKKIMNSLSIK